AACAGSDPSVPTAAKAEANSAAQVNSGRIDQADEDAGNWLTHGRTYSEQRFFPIESISTENVGQLGLAWSLDLDTNRGQEATPPVIDGVMYSTSAWSKVQAVDARTGEQLWLFDPKVPGERAADAYSDVDIRGRAVWHGLPL